MNTETNDSTSSAQTHVIDSPNLISAFTKSLLDCIVTVDEIYVVLVDGVQYVGRVHEVYPDASEEEDNDEEAGTTDLSYVLRDDYRGMVDEFTAIYLLPDKTLPLRLKDGSVSSSVCNNRSCVFEFACNPEIPTSSSGGLRDVVTIRTSDDEQFPVKRKLLRPCLSLTAVVQAGKGKYKGESSGSGVGGGEKETVAVEKEKGDEEVDSAYVDVDACTFDRVLLYLEHAARGEPFRFDPLLANDLLEAATTLKIAGLIEVCERVLGSFQERVRTTPIRLDEVFRRNLAGAAAPDGAGSGESSSDNVKKNRKRSETLLLMSGMVFDITRWLDEHPGGSTIIPEQALNVDCTVFFEIYHASRQSFLYLKEFYIGELALSDRERVPLPRGYAAKTMSATAGTAMEGRASDAFLDQLSRITDGWRLDVTKMAAYETYKSF